jgi:hypothetical protein
MGVTYNLVVGSWNLKISSLKDKEEDYPTVDKNNKELKYIPGKVERGYYVDPETDERVPKTYKRIKDKPADKFQKTNKVTNFKEVTVQEVSDLKEKYVYFVEGVTPDLLNKLKEGKAIKLVYSTGNGYSAYYGMIFYSPFHNRVLMRLGNAFISEQIKDIELGREADNKLKDVTLQEEGVSRGQVEDILTL